MFKPALAKRLLVATGGALRVITVIVMITTELYTAVGAVRVFVETAPIVRFFTVADTRILRLTNDDEVGAAAATTRA